jgi:hypothetical protein
MATHPDNTTREKPREQAPARFGSARQYDEYRVKLYKVACREARDKREQLRLDWETRHREED